MKKFGLLAILLVLASASAAQAQIEDRTLVVRVFSDWGGSPVDPQVRLSAIRWDDKIEKGRIYTCRDVHPDWQANCWQFGEFVLSVPVGRWQVETAGRGHMKSAPQTVTFDAYNFYQELHSTVTQSPLRILDFGTYNNYGWIILAYRVRNESGDVLRIQVDGEVNGSSLTAFETEIAGDTQKSKGRIQPGQETWVYRYYQVPPSAYGLPYGTHYEVKASITLLGDTGYVLAQDKGEVPVHYWFWWWGGGKG